MRWFSTFFLVLNTLFLCCSLMYCNAYLHNVCMLNSILVYVNVCMFWYRNIQCYIVYMNSVSRLCVRKVRLSHVCIEQAKLFSYSLPSTYEQHCSQVNLRSHMNNLAVWMFVCMKGKCSLTWRSELGFVYLQL